MSCCHPTQETTLKERRCPSPALGGGGSCCAAPTQVETPGLWAVAFDSARTNLFALALLMILAPSLQWPLALLAALILALASGGRSASIGWSRLERLHRMLEQQHHEIQDHREQERSELLALYQLKGLEQPLLGQVVDVLMADSDRLLKVMLEEELGLSLASCDHPLSLACASLLGSFVGSTALLLLASASGSYSLACTLLSGLIGAVAAGRIGNDRLKAMIWNSSACLVLLLITQWISGGIR